MENMETIDIDSLPKLIDNNEIVNRRHAAPKDRG
jgi:hypothetical protein